MLPTDKRLLALTGEQLEFIEYSMLCDDPEALKKLETTVVDSGYDDFVKELEEEENAKVEKEREKQRTEEGRKIDAEELEQFKQRLLNPNKRYEDLKPPTPITIEPKKIDEDDFVPISAIPSDDNVDDFEPIDL